MSLAAPGRRLTDGHKRSCCSLRSIRYASMLKSFSIPGSSDQRSSAPARSAVKKERVRVRVGNR